MTLFAEVSGTRVSKLDLMLPYYGLWAADVEIPIDSPVPTQCVLTVADLSLVGKIVRTDSFAGLRNARIVGGFGGWSTALPTQEYFAVTGVKVSTIMNDAASIIGEQVVVANDTTVGPYFFRRTQQASRLLHRFSPLWWVDPTGKTQLGTARSAAAITTSFLIETFDPGTGRLVASTENPSDWQPGRSVSNKTLTTPRTLSLVRHTMTNDGILRTEALAA